jgi:preprotein translocase subunit SecG
LFFRGGLKGFMELVILLLHVLVAAAMIGLVLLQHGKGADMGAAFGSGASGSLFGATGSANFLSRATAILATIFFLTSLSLTYFSSDKAGYRGVMVNPPAPAQAPSTPASSEAPAAPASKAQEVPK